MGQLIRFICAYLGTGKDVLTNHLNSCKGPFSWAIYHSKDNKIAFPQVYGFRLAHNKIAFPYGYGFRLAFADEIKREVRIEQKLPVDFDDKEKVLPTKKTFRQHCIEKGCGRRKEDPFYWCRLAFNQMEKEDQKSYVTVSDFRFYEELEYARSVGEVITIRVFRKEVPIPKITVPENDPEHTLDNLKTDFLVVPLENHNEQIGVAKEIFKQYHNFEYMESIPNEVCQESNIVGC